MQNIKYVVSNRGENKRMMKSTSKLLVLLSLSAIVMVACGGVPATIAPVATMPLSPTGAEMPTEAAPPTEISLPTAEPTQAIEPSPEAIPLLPEIDPATLRGDIVTAGSSTVFPLSERMADRFEQESF